MTPTKDVAERECIHETEKIGSFGLLLPWCKKHQQFLSVGTCNGCPDKALIAIAREKRG